MNEHSSINKSSDATCSTILDTLMPDVTSDIKTIADLWALARMTKDVEGDPVWEVLYQLECNPEPMENIGYNFDYKGLTGIYIPMRKSSGIIRFALPKLAGANVRSREEITDLINLANSMVTESKFSLMGDEVWLIYERHLSGNEDYPTMILHILDNLKSGAELFYNMSSV